MDVPLIFYFSSAILFASAYYFHAYGNKAKREKREFYLHTAVDDLSALSEPRDRPKLSGTAVIIGGRFVHAVIKDLINSSSQPFRPDGSPCLLRTL
jgi:hypothetical protein